MKGLRPPQTRVSSRFGRSFGLILKLNAADVEDENLRKILSGVSSIVDGIAGLRTRKGSAHGRDTRKSYRIEARHARLASHAAFTLATFFLETVEKRLTQF